MDTPLRNSQLVAKAATFSAAAAAVGLLVVATVTLTARSNLAAACTDFCSAETNVELMAGLPYWHLVMMTVTTAACIALRMWMRPQPAAADLPADLAALAETADHAATADV